MVTKTFRKTLWRCFLKNKARFLANFFIVMLSIAISCGLLALPEIFQESFSKTYQENKAPDLILKGKTQDGFSSDDLQLIECFDDVEEVLPMMAFDYESEDSDEVYRFYIYDFKKAGINLFTLVDGNYPEDTYSFEGYNGIVFEQENKNRTPYHVGDELQLDLMKMFASDMENISVPIPEISFRVDGIVNTPLYTSVQPETPWLENNPKDKKVTSIFYLDRALFPDRFVFRKFGMTLFDVPSSSFLVNTDVFVRFNVTHAYFQNSYQKEMEIRKERYVALFGQDKVEALTLEENASYATFKNYNGKVKKISYVFPLFFLLLSALVNLITMTRLIEDERGIIGCYVSLGFSKRVIQMKYLLFTFISTFSGLISGFLVGVPLIPTVVLNAYKAVFRMSSISIRYLQPLGFVVMFVLLLITLTVTFFSSYNRMKEKPSELLKQKAPKPGKKILLERIPFVWNPLPFRLKSSIRNIFRQKKNLILTSLSIIGSTLLCLLGFGLMDISTSLLDDPVFSDVASSMGLISTVIILFALFMTVIVVYSLTNMNIQEREREIATLKVLGYHNRECSFYTFREMLMITLIAVLIGLPCSYGVMYFVFSYLEFGSANDVKFTSYLFTFLVIVLTTVLVNFLLYPKIKKVDMNDSLKTLE